MDFRAQDNEMRTSGSLSYGTTHFTSKESSAGGEKRRSSSSAAGIHNGTYTSQTLDYHIQQHQQPISLGRDPDPDRVAPIAAVGVGPGPGPKSSSKTPSSTASIIRFRECLKNHAANIGGNVFDGCGEFMPSGDEGTLEALKCAACDCHRNFHRKEVDGETTPFSPGSRRSAIMLSPLQLPPPLPSPSALHHHHHHKFSMNVAPIIQPMNVAFGGGGGGGTESSSEDLNAFQSEAGGVAVPPYALSKKRFRTKFTPEQKERMMDFAEKVGWRIQKKDEEEVERFCAEVGVKRQVLRVWMHNNKNSVVKKQHEIIGITPTTDQSLENVVEQPEAGGEEGTDT